MMYTREPELLFGFLAPFNVTHEVVKEDDDDDEMIKTRKGLITTTTK